MRLNMSKERGGKKQMKWREGIAWANKIVYFTVFDGKQFLWAIANSDACNINKNNNNNTNGGKAKVHYMDNSSQIVFVRVRENEAKVERKGRRIAGWYRCIFTRHTRYTQLIQNNQSVPGVISLRKNYAVLLLYGEQIVYSLEFVVPVGSRNPNSNWKFQPVHINWWSIWKLVVHLCLIWAPWSSPSPFLHSAPLSLTNTACLKIGVDRTERYPYKIRRERSHNKIIAAAIEWNQP